MTRLTGLGGAAERQLLVMAVALVAAAAAVPAAAQPAARPERVRSIDELVTDAMRAQLVPGAVVAVVFRDSIVMLKPYGSTAFGSVVTLMNADAVFRAGAVSEVVNAIAAVRLATAGRVPLDAPVGPRLRGLPPELGPATLAQLLTHTAGMAQHVAVPGRGGADDLGAAVRRLTRYDRMAPAGAIYSPSEPGVAVAGLVVEAVAGKPYAAAVRDLVLAPVGMTGAGYGQPAVGRFVRGWTGSSAPDNPFRPAEAPADSAVHQPSRGLHATARDLARLTAALLSDGTAEGEPVLPPEVVAEVWRTRAVVPASTRRVAPGMLIDTWHDRPSVRIEGSRGGHSVLIRMLRTDQLGVVILTNNGSASLGAVADEILRRALGITTAATPARRAPSDPAVLAALAAAPGAYENGSEILEVRVADDGTPVLRSGDLDLELAPLPDGRIGAVLAGRVGLSFRLVRDEAGRRYLWLGDRALARVADFLPD